MEEVPKISEFLRSNFKAKCSLWIPVERKLLTAWVRTLYTHQGGVGSNQNVGGQTENRKSTTDNYVSFCTFGPPKIWRANVHPAQQAPTLQHIEYMLGYTMASSKSRQRSGIMYTAVVCILSHTKGS